MGAPLPVLQRRLVSESSKWVGLNLDGDHEAIPFEQSCEMERDEGQVFSVEDVKENQDVHEQNCIDSTGQAACLNIAHTADFNV